jgi:hypothetical protein
MAFSRERVAAIRPRLGKILQKAMERLPVWRERRAESRLAWTMDRVEFSEAPVAD